MSDWFDRNATLLGAIVFIIALSVGYLVFNEMSFGEFIIGNLLVLIFQKAAYGLNTLYDIRLNTVRHKYPETKDASNN